MLSEINMVVKQNLNSQLLQRQAILIIFCYMKDGKHYFVIKSTVAHLLVTVLKSLLKHIKSSMFFTSSKCKCNSFGRYSTYLVQSKASGHYSLTFGGQCIKSKRKQSSSSHHTQNF